METSSVQTGIMESIPKGSPRVIYEEGDVTLSLIENEGELTLARPLEAARSFINFYFCTEGSAEFVFGPS